MVDATFSQLLAPGSLTRMLKNASEASGAFVLIGLANGTPIAALGILMTGFKDWPQVAVDLAIGAGTIIAVRETHGLSRGWFSREIGVASELVLLLWLRGARRKSPRSSSTRRPTGRWADGMGTVCPRLDYWSSYRPGYCRNESTRTSYLAGPQGILGRSLRAF